MLIKICGLKNQKDIALVNQYHPDFIGMVMFFPKSHRNLEPEVARNLLKDIDPDIKKVAVTVSPTVEQIKVINDLGFDFIQIHGELLEANYDACKLPIWKAFNVSDLTSFDSFKDREKIAGFVFDAGAPGSGKTFDYQLLSRIKTDKLFVLAGGLNATNVLEAINLVKATQCVDVSTGVELADKSGKDPVKVKELIELINEKA